MVTYSQAASAASTCDTDRHRAGAEKVKAGHYFRFPKQGLLGSVALDP